MTVYLLNLFDLICTLYALDHGAAELNPLMQNVSFMIFYKVVIVGGLLLSLAGRKEKTAIYGVKVCTAVYGAIAAWHLIGIASIFI